MPSMMAAGLQETVQVVDPPQVQRYLYVNREFLDYLINYHLYELPPISISRVNILPDGPSAELFPPIPTQTVLGPMMGPGGLMLFCMTRIPIVIS